MSFWIGDPPRLVLYFTGKPSTNFRQEHALDKVASFRRHEGQANELASAQHQVCPSQENRMFR